MKILNENNKEIKLEDCDLSIGCLMSEICIKEDATPIDNVTKFAWADEDYENIQRYVVVPEETRFENRINELKRKLSNTDYAVIKIAEGAATAEDYAKIILDRETWRSEINELEEKLKEINK